MFLKVIKHQIAWFILKSSYKAAIQLELKIHEWRRQQLKFLFREINKDLKMKTEMESFIKIVGSNLLLCKIYVWTSTFNLPSKLG